MRILRHRPTRHFTALLIGCRCGRRFLHRLDRPLVVCLGCGALKPLEVLVATFRAADARARRRTPKDTRGDRRVA